MNILYAIQATGNGHISRAHQVIPYLKQYGTVDTILSGANATLDCEFEVTYRSGGLSLFYKKCGGLNYRKMFWQNSLLRARKDAKALPLEKYDLVINDFDYITALACKMHEVPSIQFGHQASFMSGRTPRPQRHSRVGEYILKHYAKAEDYVGLHFRRYDDFVLPPVIKHNVLTAKPKDMGHVTVYLPSYEVDCLVKCMSNVEEVQFQYFTSEVNAPTQRGNVLLRPISDSGFTESLVSSHGLITGGGFETPSEAIYLGKKLMCIPIRNHYEQACNAAALKEMGVCVLSDINTDQWANQIKDWLATDYSGISVEANDLASTVKKVINTAHKRSTSAKL